MRKYINLCITLLACGLLFGLLALPFTTMSFGSFSITSSCYDMLVFDSGDAGVTAYAVLTVIAMAAAGAAFVAAVVQIFAKEPAKIGKIVKLLLLVATLLLLGAMICNIVLTTGEGMPVGVGAILVFVTTLLVTAAAFVLDTKRK